jgi:hypothetical protein
MRPAATTDVAARIIVVAATCVAGLLALGIIFTLLSGNPRNDIVSLVFDIARTLAGPFDRMFVPSDPKLATAANWGIALVVYLILARLIAALLRRAGVALSRPDRSAGTE